jgi:hypothetical protein
VDDAHKTAENFVARGAFTVSVATADYVTECDYLGVVSGNTVPDRVARAGLHTVKSEFVDAPVMSELPLVLECELVSMNEENCNVVGKIVNCAVEEAALTDGKPDAAKMKPICFDPCAHVYRIMGDAVANLGDDGRLATVDRDVNLGEALAQAAHDELGADGRTAELDLGGVTHRCLLP